MRSAIKVAILMLLYGIRAKPHSLAVTHFSGKANLNEKDTILCLCVYKCARGCEIIKTRAEMQLHGPPVIGNEQPGSLYYIFSGAGGTNKRAPAGHALMAIAKF